jgi:hypothetical protein
VNDYAEACKSLRDAIEDYINAATWELRHKMPPLDAIDLAHATAGKAVDVIAAEKSQRLAGARFEREIADWLAANLDDRIDRRVKTGAKDCGDLAGIRVHGQRVTAELKNRRDWQPGTWLREAEKERVNDAALATFVVAKRHGSADPGAQVVLMTVRDLVAIITGARAEES